MVLDKLKRQIQSVGGLGGLGIMTKVQNPSACSAAGLPDLL